jgi:hypothetical protein
MYKYYLFIYFFSWVTDDSKVVYSRILQHAIIQGR